MKTQRSQPRKRQSDDDKRIIGFEAEDALIRRLDRLANSQKRSRSYVMRELLLTALEHEKAVGG